MSSKWTDEVKDKVGAEAERVGDRIEAEYKRVVKRKVATWIAIVAGVGGFVLGVVACLVA